MLQWCNQKIGSSAAVLKRTHPTKVAANCDVHRAVRRSLNVSNLTTGMIERRTSSAKTRITTSQLGNKRLFFEARIKRSVERVTQRVAIVCSQNTFLNSKCIE